MIHNASNRARVICDMSRGKSMENLETYSVIKKIKKEFVLAINIKYIVSLVQRHNPLCLILFFLMIYCYRKHRL